MGKVLGVLVFASFVVLLDGTTSLFPSPADHLWPIPRRSALGWALTFAAALPFLVWFARRVPALVRGFRACGIPLAPRVVLALFALGMIGHIALRQENYPFSDVAMFSSAVPPRDLDKPLIVRTLLVHRGHGVLLPMSMLREGSALGNQLGLGWDYKKGWAAWMYATSYSKALAYVTDELSRVGRGEPLIGDVSIDPRTGKILGSTVRR